MKDAVLCVWPASFGWCAALALLTLQCRIYDQLIATKSINDLDAKIEVLQHIVAKLPYPNILLLNYMLGFLAKVERNKKNGESVASLSAYWGLALMRPPGGLGTIDATMIRDITAMIILLIQQRSRIINLSDLKSPTKDADAASPEPAPAPEPAPVAAPLPEPSAGGHSGALASVADKKSKAQKLAEKFSKKPAAAAAAAVSKPQQQLSASSSRDASPAKLSTTVGKSPPRADSDDSLLPMGAKVASSGWRSSAPKAQPAGASAMAEGSAAAAAVRPSAPEPVTEQRERAGASDAYTSSRAANGSAVVGSAEVHHPSASRAFSRCAGGLRHDRRCRRRPWAGRVGFVRGLSAECLFLCSCCRGCSPCLSCVRFYRVRYAEPSMMCTAHPNLPTRWPHGDR